MKKIFTLISMAFVAMSVNAQTEESYTAVDADGNMAAEYAAIVGEDGETATNVENGNSIVKFSTANVSVEGVGSGVPADKVDPDDPSANIGQDITIGNVIDADAHTYELVSINSTKPITWQVANQGDINFYYIKGQGNPSVSRYARQNSKEGDWVPDAYTVVDVAFDPATGGEPQSGLYYKFTTKVDGALKVGIWAFRMKTLRPSTMLQLKLVILGLLALVTKTSGVMSSLMPRLARPIGSSRVILRLVSRVIPSLLASLKKK